MATQASIETASQQIDPSFLTWSTLGISVLIVATLFYWKKRFLPFIGHTSPPTYLVVWIVLLACSIALLGLTQLYAGEVFSRWVVWLGILLTLLGIVSKISFEAARACFPNWVNIFITVFAGIALLSFGLWWIFDPRWILVFLLFLVLIYLIWTGGVMLVCASKPPQTTPPPGSGLSPQPDENGHCPDITVNVHRNDTKTHIIPSKLRVADNPLQHFVTVNGSGNVILQAVVSPDEAITWEASGGQIISPGVGSDRKTAKISRSNSRGAKITVRIKVGDTVCKTFIVWIIWCSMTPKITGRSLFAPFEQLGLDSELNNLFYKPRAGINWAAKINPSAIITDRDRPAIEDQTKAPVPGADSGVPGPRNLDDTLSGFNGWGISRQIRKKVFKGGPNRTPAIPIFETADTDRVTHHRPESYPADDVTGNDDSTAADEDDNPYSLNDLGILRSDDNPGNGIFHNRSFDERPRPQNGDIIRYRLHFREFVRVQLGNTWYRCSDWGLWRAHQNMKFENGRWGPERSNKDKLELNNKGWN